MPSSAHRFATLALVVVCACAPEPATRQASGRAAEGVRVVEDPGVVARSDRLVFPRDGHRDLLDLEPGTVLASRVRGGFLRKVRSVRAAGDEIVVKTEPASLGEAFIDAKLNERLALGGAGGGTTTAEPDSAVGRSSEALSTPGFDVTVGPRRIHQDTDIEAEVLEARFDFDPEVELDVQVEDRRLERLKMRAVGQLDAGLRVHIEASGDPARVDVDQKLWSRQQPFVQVIGGVPVVEVVKLELGVGVEGEIRGEVQAEVGGGVDAAVSVGSVYEGEVWRDLGGQRLELTGDAPEVRGEGEVEAIRAYLYARISVKLYDVAGPYVDVRPNVVLTPDEEGEWHVARAGLRGEFGVRAGLPIIDLTTGIYRSLLFDVSHVLDRRSIDEGPSTSSASGGDTDGDGGTASGTDDAPSGCPSVPPEGECEDGILRTCDGGEVRERDCVAERRGCGWIADEDRFGCVDGCGGLDFEGACVGDELRYCSSGLVVSRACDDGCGQPHGASSHYCL